MGRLVLVSAAAVPAAWTGPSGPSTHPARNDTRPFDSDTLFHRNPSSCARRAPVNAANTKNTWSS